MKLTKLEIDELISFVMSLDFKKLNNKEVLLIENRYDIEELPKVIKDYLEFYLNEIELIG